MTLKDLASYAQPALESALKKQPSLLYGNLSTEDGFVLGHVVGDRSRAEPDKVAALVSSLFSLAESSAEDASSDKLGVLIMESERSACVVRRASIRSNPVVLTLAMTRDVSLGHVHYSANHIAGLLKAL